MDWLILSFVIIAMSVFLSIKIAMVHPSVNSIELTPPTILTERLNSLPPDKQAQVINIAEQFNYTVETLSNNMTIIYPKFNIEKTTSEK